MVTTTLLVGGTFSLLIAGFFFTVGRRIAARPVHTEARPPLFHFGMWWLALAASTVLQGLEQYLAAFGVTPLSVFAPLTYVNFFLISIALLGLMYYLVYLLTGRTGALGGLVLFYFAFFLLVVFVISRADPNGVTVDTWSVSLTYATPLEGPLVEALLLLLLVPPMLGALGYMSLLTQVDGFSQRYRIGLVSTSLFLWFGSTYGASLVGISDTAWWPVVGDSIGLLAAIAIWAAYLPPGWLRDRLGVEPLGGGATHGVRPGEDNPGV